MNTELNIQSEIDRVLLILSKKKWLIIGISLFVLLPVQYFNMTTPRIYEAEVKIKHEEKEFGISDGNLVQFPMNKNYIENLIYEITSYSLMNQVAMELPDSIVNEMALLNEIKKNKDFYANLTHLLLRNTDVRPLLNSDVISIKVQCQNATSSAFIANKIAELIRIRNRNQLLGDVNQVRNTVEEQLKYFEEKVKSSERALMRFKEQNKITYLTEESQEIFKRITEAETAHNTIKADLDASQERLRFVKSKLAKDRGDLVLAITTTTSPWATKLKEQLVELEVQYTTLKVQNYSESHPKMQSLKSQIEETKKNLEEETIKIAMGENTIDPLSEIQKSLKEIAELEVDIHTYQAQDSALANIIQEYNHTLEKLPEKELELGRLTRDKNVADKIYTMLLEKREEARIKEAEKTGNIYIVDKAQIPRKPIKPKKSLNLMLGLFLGISFSVCIVFINEMINRKIYTIEDIERNFKIDIIGTVPNANGHQNFMGDFRKNVSSANNKIQHLFSIDSGKHIAKHDEKKEPNNGKDNSLYNHLVIHMDPKAPVSEAFRTLRTNLHSISKRRGHLKSFLVTGATPEIGKSFVAANLAISNAQLGFKTLLIDTDLRKPIVEKILKIKMKPGLTHLIEEFSNVDPSAENEPKRKKSTKNRDEQNKYKSFIHTTRIKNLSVLPCGSIPENPSELLASESVNYLILKLKSYFDVIILDSPPILVVPDALCIAPFVDGIVFVARASKNTHKDIALAKKLIDRIKDNHMLGLVLNDINKGEDYYSHYYYHPNKN